jgi:hypothetical protein
MAGKYNLGPAVVIATIFLLTLVFPDLASAQDCIPESIRLSTQQEVDDFQANHGPCTRVVDVLWIYGADSEISNLDGLSDLTHVGGHLDIMQTDLTNLDGLSSLTSVGGGIGIRTSSMLENVNGLSRITQIGANLIIGRNVILADLDGLSGLNSVGGDISIDSNGNLNDCSGLRRLVDEVDDADPGPGPGVGGAPDTGGSVWLRANGAGCNSIRQILLGITAFRINSGLNDAWFETATPGQGFLITVLPEIKQIFLAWFTFDVERPAEGAEAHLGEAGHRWLTAQGGWDDQDNMAHLSVFLTKGGVFDSIEPKPETGDSIGEIYLRWDDCEQAELLYEIDQPPLQGAIPLVRVAPDNVPLCEALSSDD